MAQYGYQQREMVALTHFNMGTYTAPSTCDASNWNSNAINASNPRTFNPYALNVSNWVESYMAMGAKSAVLTAKHGCGFCLWPTKVLIPPQNTPYTYSVPYSGYTQDILAEFTQAMSQHGLGYGFYYSLPNNFFLNLRNYKVPGTLLPGQANVTVDQINQICLAQLTELFTLYGNLTEFWFDGGTATLVTAVHDLITKYQPQMAVFGGQQVSQNMVRYVGTESGNIPSPIWSLGMETGTGDPSSSQFCPACCDTPLQYNDQWFYNPAIGISTLAQLQQVYHDAVGNNGVLELDFGIDTTGNVAAAQAQRYKEFGDWIRSCYGASNAVNRTQGNLSPADNTHMLLDLVIPHGSTFDRVMVQENLLYGQRIRNFSIVVDGVDVYASTSVGQKRIVLLKAPVTNAVTVQLNVTGFVGEEVYVANLAVFSPTAC